jgi:hypothetical protein
MKDQQGRRIVDNSARGKIHQLDSLEHRTRRKERQAGEALKMWVKLTYSFRHLGFWYLGF